MKLAVLSSWQLWAVLSAVLDARHVALLAAQGCASVHVRRRPRVVDYTTSTSGNGQER